MGDSRNTGTISNLSSALRQVNIGSGQDQKNINYEFSNGLNNNVNDNGNHNLVNTSEDNVNKDGSINTNMMSRQVPIQHTHGSQLLQQERMNEQQFNPMEYSRISKFFQNQPMEGYTLFSHRSAPNGFKVSIV